MRVIIDGVAIPDAAAAVSVFDWVVVRGFGVFEVVRSYGGSLFRLAAHLDRLERSATALALPIPDRAGLVGDMTTLAASAGDGLVRVIITGGGRDESVSAPVRTVVIWEPLPPDADELRVLPMLAPWHPTTDLGGYAGVKWTSYAPNMATTDRARRAGFDDALLMSGDRIVLEGPTYSIAWLHDGWIETPSLDLGILPSITREVLFECASRIGLEVKQGQYPLDRLLASEEAIALSTVKQIVPIVALAEASLPSGPIAGLLAAAFSAIVAEET